VFRSSGSVCSTARRHISGLDDAGLQQESWEVLDFEQLPIEWHRDESGRPVRVKVPLPGRDVVVQVWTVLVGRTRLYLLDTDVRQNRRNDREITARLYGGDQETAYPTGARSRASAASVRSRRSVTTPRWHTSTRGTPPSPRSSASIG